MKKTRLLKQEEELLQQINQLEIEISRNEKMLGVHVFVLSLAIIQAMFAALAIGLVIGSSFSS